jgi:hypothetical protein
MKALRSFSILDTFSEKEYDEITLLTSVIRDTPRSLTAIIDFDNQLFKSKVGLEIGEAPRELSFCGLAIFNNGSCLPLKILI